MPSLDCQYSVEFEMYRVKNTLRKYAWYKEHRYPVALPPTLEPTAPPCDNTLFELVQADYVDSEYLIPKERLCENWKDLAGEVDGSIRKIFPFMVDNYVVQLTRYGVGGSYQYPNTIVTNIQFKKEGEVIRTVFHELIHLAIHPLVEKHNIEHWQKERLVDLATVRLSPRYGRFQKIPIQTDKVDSIFAAQFPDIEGIIKSLSA